MADYDYIIVGGGSAGCALANRVSEDPAAHVLLLGSRPTRRFDVDRHPGGLHEPAQPPALHFGGLPPSRSRTCTVARPQSRAARPSADRARSTAWSMCGNPLDYETWVQFGNRGWSYEGVLPYSRNPSITSRAAMARAVAAVRSTLPRCANAPSWPMDVALGQATDGIWTRWWCGSPASGCISGEPSITRARCSTCWFSAAATAGRRCG